MSTTTFDVEMVRRNIISEASRKSYDSAYERLLKWVSETHPELVVDGHLNLDGVTLDIFGSFLCSRTKKDGSQVGISQLRTYRSALRNEYRRQGKQYPQKFEDDIGDFFKGLKRLDSSLRLNGGRGTTGKRPMSFSLYKQICKELFCILDGGFAHLFLVLSWNLMCRSNNTQSICFDHISAEDDSIGIRFPQTKTNQTGERPQDPRHVYANPFNPEICPILALAVYLACHPQMTSVKLFPGGKQKDRFGKALQRALKLVLQGLNENQNIATHSIRKGAGTFVCSGSTHGPSIISVCIRCDWAMGGVQDRYLRFENAGDQFLGRIVSGLPMDKREFAVLPPHFKEDDFTIHELMLKMFPHLYAKSHLINVLSLSLASLIYHYDYLVENLPKTHPLFSTELFSGKDTVKKLKEKLNDGYESNRFIASGIPPYIHMYEQLIKNYEAITRIPEEVTKKIAQLLEEKGVQAGNITHDLLKSTLNDCIKSLGLQQHKELDQGPVVNEKGRQYQVYMWGGGLHKLPEDFQFGSVDPLTCMRLWYHGNENFQYPPYKDISKHDLSTKEKRKTLSEWKAFNKYMIDLVKQYHPDKAKDNPTTKEVSEWYDLIKVYLPVTESTEKNRQRRITQIRVLTVLKLIRLEKKRSFYETSVSNNQKKRRVRQRRTNVRLIDR